MEYLMYDRDKAAFINKFNKYIGQIKPDFKISSENFIDIPGSKEEDTCIFIVSDPLEEQIMELLIKNKGFNFKIKKISSSKIIDSIKQDLD